MSEQRHQKHERLSRIRTRDFHTNIPSLCSRSHLHSPLFPIPICTCLSVSFHSQLFFFPIPFPATSLALTGWLLATGSFECSFHLTALPHCMATTWQTTGHAAQPHTHTHITIQPCSHSLSSSLLWLWLVYAHKNIYCNVHFHPSHMSPSALLHKPKQFMEDNYGNGIIVVDSMEALSSHSSRNLIIVSWSPFLFHRYSLHKILRAFLCSALEAKSGNLFLNCW